MRLVRFPPEVGDIVRIVGGPPRGFGSVRVEARIGATVWRTSIFPIGGDGGFVLPLKAAVRKAQSLEDGDMVTAVIALVDAGD